MSTFYTVQREFIKYFHGISDCEQFEETKQELSLHLTLYFEYKWHHLLNKIISKPLLSGSLQQNQTAVFTLDEKPTMWHLNHT